MSIAVSEDDFKSIDGGLRPHVRELIELYEQARLNPVCTYCDDTIFIRLSHRFATGAVNAFLSFLPNGGTGTLEKITVGRGLAFYELTIHENNTAGYLDEYPPVYHK